MLLSGSVQLTDASAFTHRTTFFFCTFKRNKTRVGTVHTTTVVQQGAFQRYTKRQTAVAARRQSVAYLGQQWTTTDFSGFCFWFLSVKIRLCEQDEDVSPRPKEIRA